MTNNIALFETELIALLKIKDEKAFNYLYDNYSGALCGIILKVLNQEELANDVLQEVFVKIWRSIEQYDSSKGRLYTWMLNIARNSAIDTLRSKGFQQGQKTSDIGNNAYLNDGRRSSTNNTDVLGLKKSVLNLKPEFRVLINLAYFQGFTQEEISQTLNIPLGTVKTRMRNALLELKSIFV
ncbi:MAG: sigma-70 family RNA polymerase sigma factor [Phycisphaerales bacterium]|nr:sigma-70 family RNA polymerase sigma factor [Phycisphaerales bacterium]